MKRNLIIPLMPFLMIGMLNAQVLQTWDISLGRLFKGPESAPLSIAMHENLIFIGGHFTRLNANTPYVLQTGHVSYFSNDRWQDMKGGLNGPVYAMHSAQDRKLYVAGGFTGSTQDNMKAIAYWNGLDWIGIPGFSIGSINALEHDGISLYAGGIFPGIGEALSPAIARYSNGSWHSLKNGLRNMQSNSIKQAEVKAMKYAHGKLYVGGQFDSAGNIPVQNIAYWDGTDWHGMGAGIPGIINDIAVMNNGHVIVSSTIENGLKREPAPLMSWDGFQWNSIGLPPRCNAIQALETDGLNLYIGGDFAMDTTKNDFGLAQWDGSSFSSIGGGVIGTIKSLEYHDGMLYCGGTFLRVSDSLACRNIAGYKIKEKKFDGLDSSQKIRTYPNPNQSGMMSISFTLEEPGEAKICLAALDGRIIQCFAEGFYAKGLHEVQLLIDGISSGQYQCSVFHQGDILTTMLIIMH
jgi:hypothetical protein